jgi:hypothetical protein
MQLAAQPPTVCDLRDRLLQEARSERQRCLEVAEAAERRRSEFRGAASVGAQTENTNSTADALSMDVGSSSFAHRPSGSIDAGFGAPPAERDEDKEQMEAIQALMKLDELGSTTRLKEEHASVLCGQVHSERQQREKANELLASERLCKESAQQQVICLESELDSREAALQAAEDLVERRTAELGQALLEISVLEEHCCKPQSREAIILENECLNLRSQLNERDYQLELKDRHIAHLLTMLRTRGVYLEEDSFTTCRSEKSVAMTVSTAASLGHMSTLRSLC